MILRLPLLLIVLAMLGCQMYSCGSISLSLSDQQEMRYSPDSSFEQRDEGILHAYDASFSDIVIEPTEPESPGKLEDTRDLSPSNTSPDHLSHAQHVVTVPFAVSATSITAKPSHLYDTGQSTSEIYVQFEPIPETHLLQKTILRLQVESRGGRLLDPETHIPLQPIWPNPPIYEVRYHQGSHKVLFKPYQIGETVFKTTVISETKRIDAQGRFVAFEPHFFVFTDSNTKLTQTPDGYVWELSVTGDCLELPAHIHPGITKVSIKLHIPNDSTTGHNDPFEICSYPIYSGNSSNITAKKVTCLFKKIYSSFPEKRDASLVAETIDESLLPEECKKSCNTSEDCGTVCGTKCVSGRCAKIRGHWYPIHF